MGMATLPASGRPPAVNLGFRPQPHLAIELPERLSLPALLHEKIVLFSRRRMLDWKSQLTRLVVVISGSALIFLAWKSLISWLA
jgi:hypothetical protein